MIWQLNTQSDLDAAEKQVKDLQAQIDEGKQSGSEAAASYQAAYADLEQELGATQQDLAATQQELTDAQQAADAAEQQAAEAKQRAEDATNATDKAAAEADQAQAELDAAQSRATITKDCANAFVSELAAVAQSRRPNGSGGKRQGRPAGHPGRLQDGLGLLGSRPRLERGAQVRLLVLRQRRLDDLAAVGA